MAGIRIDGVACEQSSKSTNTRMARRPSTARRSMRSDPPAAGRVRACLSTWAMLVKRVYEVDPLECPKCGGAMKIISFIERRQRAVIERILRHCNLWQGPVRTLVNARGPPSDAQQDSAEPHELQLVLDPEFL